MKKRVNGLIINKLNPEQVAGYLKKIIFPVFLTNGFINISGVLKKYKNF